MVIVWCLHWISTGLVWCRQGASRFLYMGGLVLAELQHLNQPHARRFVAFDEARGGQVVKELIDVAVVVWEHFGLDAPRPIFEPPFPISQAPEPLEEQPCAH